LKPKDDQFLSKISAESLLNSDFKSTICLEKLVKNKQIIGGLSFCNGLAFSVKIFFEKKTSRLTKLSTHGTTLPWFPGVGPGLQSIKINILNASWSILTVISLYYENFGPIFVPEAEKVNTEVYINLLGSNLQGWYLYLQTIKM
jgi:hypothetical protein